MTSSSAADNNRPKPLLDDADLAERIFRHIDDGTTDLGAFEFSNVTLAVQGTPTPGGVLTVSAVGTPGLATLVLVGLDPGEVLFPPFGSVLFAPSSLRLVLPLGALPGATTLPIPAGAPLGTTAILQAFARDTATGFGNVSNAVTVVVE